MEFITAHWWVWLITLVLSCVSGIALWFASILGLLDFPKWVEVIYTLVFLAVILTFLGSAVLLFICGLHLLGVF